MNGRELKPTKCSPTISPSAKVWKYLTKMPTLHFNWETATNQLSPSSLTWGNSNQCLCTHNKSNWCRITLQDQRLFPTSWQPRHNVWLFTITLTEQNVLKRLDKHQLVSIQLLEHPCTPTQHSLRLTNLKQLRQRPNPPTQINSPNLNPKSQLFAAFTNKCCC